MLTVKGYYIIENGGYAAQSQRDAVENTRPTSLETSCTDQSLTDWIAGGAIAAALYYQAMLFEYLRQHACLFP